MRYMPINSGSVLHGIWDDLRLRELKDKLEEMHVMYELSHKKGASMSNKKFVSFQDLTLSRNELGLVVVSGLPTGDSTLNVVPPIGSVQTDKIGFNDLSIDERCALWALIYGQTVNTVGQPYYAKAEERRMGKGWDLEAQANPLALCLYPEALVELKIQ